MLGLHDHVSCRHALLKSKIIFKQLNLKDKQVASEVGKHEFD